MKTNTTTPAARVRSMRTEPALKKLTGAETTGPARCDRGRTGTRARFGNPFRIGPDGDRAAVIEKYRRWLWRRIWSGEITPAMLIALEGRDLVCWCAPEKCHCDVLLRAITWACTVDAETCKPV